MSAVFESIVAQALSIKPKYRRPATKVSMKRGRAKPRPRGETQRLIEAMLREHGRMTTLEIAERLERSRDSVDEQLRKMRDACILSVEVGKGTKPSVWTLIR